MIDRMMWDEIEKAVSAISVVDAHTHVQDDIQDFDAEKARANLAGTQASVNRPSPEAVQEGLRRGKFVRRTMTDIAHGLFYSWFAEIAEGHGGRLDEAAALVGANSDAERRRAARFLLGELRDSRYSEYAEWIRYMFRLYTGTPRSVDPLDPEACDAVADAIAAQRHDPEFASSVLSSHRIAAYVTSIENRDRVPASPPIHPEDVDLTYGQYADSWNMFDFNGFLWPDRATDFGLFTQGHKFQAERYVAHLAEYLQQDLGDVKQLQRAVRDFFFRIIRSPKSNPTSRILYVDGFQHHSWRFSAPYSRARVDWALRHCREQIDEQTRGQVVSCVGEAMLEALNEIGGEYRAAGFENGACIQLCGGARHFMDWAREIQSLPEYIPNLAQDEYCVWTRYPNVHFEYICAHELLYRDMANAAKQVANVSAGPWWHFFRRRKIADLIVDQLSMGPIRSIACGFTDARFVEMIAAKYRSLRLAVTDALATLASDPYSTMYHDVEAASNVATEMLYTNPASIHHIPVNG